MCPNAPYFILLLCLTPEDFTRQGESLALELCAGVSEPELRHMLPELELDNSGKNSGRQNYEKLFHISMNFWYGKINLNDLTLL
jgi:hypothetical protein